MKEKILEIKDAVDEFDKSLYGKGDGYLIKTDKQTIKILIGNGQNCCEDWGSFSTEDDFDDFIGADLLDIKLTDTCLKTELLKRANRFDLDPRDIQFVDLETSKGTLQFAVYNSHNGYYGHSIVIRSEQVTYEGSL